MGPSTYWTAAGGAVLCLVFFGSVGRLVGTRKGGGSTQSGELWTQKSWRSSIKVSSECIADSGGGQVISVSFFFFYYSSVVVD